MILQKNDGLVHRIPDGSVGPSGLWWHRQQTRDLYIHLGQSLVERGLLTNESFTRAINLSDEQNSGLVSILVSLGLINEQSLAGAISDIFEIPFFSKADLNGADELQGEINEPFLQANNIVPVAEASDLLTIAMADPLDRFARSSIEMRCAQSVRFVVATASDIAEALARRPRPGGLVDDGSSHLNSPINASQEDIARLEDLASDAPVIRYVNQLIRNAVDARASDIHVEPQEAGIELRFRIDGVLRNVPVEMGSMSREAIISRIKILARLDIAEHRLPQDGSARIAVRGHQIDLRVSTLPTSLGESVVVRILDRSFGIKAISDLGIGDNDLARLLSLLERPNGIVLVTGPTGSGKTTTLYAALQKLKGPDRKLVTVEDPVEYQIDGLTQIQVKPQIDLTFAKVLRSVLRHDPDIVMIGEIRDLETARIAVQASLTGHLVLSTLHTNSAVSAIGRLKEMGVEAYLLAATLNGVLAQRLLRRLCPSCKRPVERKTSMEWQMLEQFNMADRAVDVYEPSGCDRCEQTGYLGRRCITEVLSISPECQHLISSGDPDKALACAAREQGMTSLMENGLSMIAAGDTSLAEVLRVVPFENG